MPLVYLIENTVNGKKYVGATVKSLDERWKQHVALARSSARLRSRMLVTRAIHKYGPGAFAVSVLEECTSEEELFAAEKKWISELETFFTKGHGYNMTVGGEGTRGHVVSLVAKVRMSEAHKRSNLSKETIGKMSASARVRYASGHGKFMRSKRKKGKEHFLYGKSWGRKGPLTAEAKAKISKAHAGKRLSNEHKAAISASCKGKPGPNKGKKWTSFCREKMNGACALRKKPVFGCDNDGKHVVAYLSVEDAMKLTGFSACVFLSKIESRRLVDGITYTRSDMSLGKLLKKGEKS